MTRRVVNDVNQGVTGEIGGSQDKVVFLSLREWGRFMKGCVTITAKAAIKIWPNIKMRDDFILYVELIWDDGKYYLQPSTSAPKHDDPEYNEKYKFIHHFTQHKHQMRLEVVAAFGWYLEDEDERAEAGMPEVSLRDYQLQYVRKLPKDIQEKLAEEADEYWTKVDENSIGACIHGCECHHCLAAAVKRREDIGPLSRYAWLPLTQDVVDHIGNDLSFLNILQTMRTDGKTMSQYSAKQLLSPRD